MQLLKAFIRRYPFQSVFLAVALLLAGIADGIGLSSLLPALQLAMSSQDDEVSHNEFAQRVHDVLARTGIAPTLGLLLSLILGAIVLKNALIFVAEQRIGYIAADVATELRMNLLTAMIASRWGFFTRQSTGGLANAMATEAWRAAQAYVFAVRVLATVIEATVYTAVAVLVSWEATILCFAAGAFVLSASHVFVRIAHRAGDKQTRWYRSLLATLSDVLQSVKTFKAMGRDHVAEEVLTLETEKLRGALRRQALGEAGIEGAQETLLAFVIVGGIFVALVSFEVQLATVTFMAVVLGQTLKRIGRVQKMHQKVLTCESAYWALDATINQARAEAERSLGSATVELSDGIEFDGVSFAYGEHRILDRVSLTIPAGVITCLVGDSGSGKTTIADLVIGLITPQSGEIRVDGKPLGSLDVRSWRHSIGYVPQENLLLHDSIFHNVVLGDPSLTRADVEAALKVAEAWDFVARLPDGIDTLVGERGTLLSGGQRQRVMIARALAHQPKLLILDEATSALDPATEADICATLRSLRGKLTILAVSHQSAMAEIADEVYRVEAGALARDDGRRVRSRLSQSVVH
ncbi:MAG TPA: ABC transporter ATP-binding protein [Pseudomonadales bacterium]|nr:ABC transporter ATP-binding protein [Pseudomonadales bacterium]